ncbi:Predicted oxidoreductase [Butyrivibrio fibrisolvens DSM 3071]|uniref:Predicted oxidoreductase n=1 Tax=Butyrivibrio fibrisolvens DSM 3071 TaxID=1121131 RepID=A0A1M5WBN8_BUTFI|nr:aldo/keto reductase [Butyrivibrio fibrisolvens]SHH84623.1 Predicted oxidoreductase [Butyrivibrio fibrisolvens DSM 3071]
MIRIDGKDVDVSRIFYGTAAEPFMSGGDGNDLIEQMVNMGVTAIDTARVYGHAEESVGRWLKIGNNRQRVTLLTKGGHPDMLWRSRLREKEVRKDLKTSLDKLCTDYVDIYLLHRDDPEVPVGEIVELLNDLYNEGKIRSFGGSNWTHERIEEANRYASDHGLIPFAVSSPCFSMAVPTREPWPGCITIAGDDNEDARKWYIDNQMPVIAYSAMAAGFFSGRFKSEDYKGAKKVMSSDNYKTYVSEENMASLKVCEDIAKETGLSVSQVAFSWIYGQDMNVYAVVSTRSVERMKQNVDAMLKALGQK